MFKHYLDIAGKWAFVIAYSIGPDDLDEVGEWLKALGARPREIRQAKRLLTKTNKGLTLSYSGCA